MTDTLHHSTTIIDPYFAATSLNKREMSHLFGNDDNMLGIPRLVDWINTQEEALFTFEKFWEVCPEADWYMLIINALDDVNLITHRYAGDLYRVSLDIDETFSRGISEEIRTSRPGMWYKKWYEKNTTLYHRLTQAPYDEFCRRREENIANGDDHTSDFFIQSSVAFDKAVYRPRKRMYRMQSALNKWLVRQPAVIAIENRYAQLVRDSGLLPDWAVVEHLLRDFYDQNSTHAYAFWEQNS